MNTLTDTLFSLQDRYPGMALLCGSALKVTLLLVMAGTMHRLLRNHSARARCWAWRCAVLSLLALAVWICRPATMEHSGVVIELPVTVETPELAAKRAELDKRPFNAALMPQGPGLRSQLRQLDSWIGRSWAWGAALFAGLGALAYGLGMKRLHRDSLEAPEEIAALCPVGMSCRLSPAVQSPLLTGWMRPTVWLPLSANDWPELRLRAAFAHEQAHQQRGDVMWQQLAQFVTVLFWWLPVTRRAASELRLAAEEAADDHSVTHALTVRDYAEALVGIAASGSEPNSSLGLAMAGTSQLESRVKALLRESPWRDRLGTMAVVAMFVSMGAMLLLTLTGCKKQEPKFVSMAKLVASSNGVMRNLDYLQDFYGTIIETLESAAMRDRALDRVRALSPDLKECSVEIRVTQNKGSAIFNVAALGEDPVYIKTYLEALLDEFRSFRDQAREEQRNKALVAMAEDTAKKEKEWKVAQGALQMFLDHNDGTLLTADRELALKQLNALAARKLEVETMLATIQTTLLQPEVAIRAKGTSDQLTADELSYVTTQVELVKQRVETEASGSVESKARLASLEKLAAAQLSEVRQCLMAQSKALGGERDLLAARDRELREGFVKVDSLLRQKESLVKAQALAEQHYRAIFDKLREFQLQEGLTSDAVSIMERSSVAMKVEGGWW
jgi:hypothetical protein